MSVTYNYPLDSRQPGVAKMPPVDGVEQFLAYVLWEQSGNDNPGTDQPPPVHV